MCLVKSNENHLRRGIERRGWFENKILTSGMFDIKFEIQDQQVYNIYNFINIIGRLHST